MRIDTHAVNIELSTSLERYAESRAWMAVRRHARRVAWLGVWMVDYQLGEDRPGMHCRIDAWLHGVGHVTVRHADRNLYVAIDIAAARLEQAIQRALQDAARRRLAIAAASDGEPAGEPGGTPRPHRPHAIPRLAVVIEPRDPGRRLSLLPWLRIAHGIEQVARLSIPRDLWDEIADGSRSAAERLESRLTLSLLSSPELIVVLGRSGHADGAPADEGQEKVCRIVRQIRAWAVPAEVVGVWVNERWGPDSHVESQELDCEARDPSGARVESEAVLAAPGVRRHDEEETVETGVAARRRRRHRRIEPEVAVQ